LDDGLIRRPTTLATRSKSTIALTRKIFQDSNKVNTTGSAVSDSISALVGAAAAPVLAALSSVASLSRRRQAGAHDGSVTTYDGTLDVPVFAMHPSSSETREYLLEENFSAEFFFVHSGGDGLLGGGHKLPHPIGAVIFRVT